MKTRYVPFLLLFLGLIACDNPTTRLPAPQVRYGSLYISCEQPPHLLNLDSVLANCASLEPLDVLENSRQIIGCSMEVGRVPPDKAHFSLDKIPEGYRVHALSAEVEVLSTAGEPVDELIATYSNAFLVARGELILRFYLRNQFVGGCPHDELLWQEYFP